MQEGDRGKKTKQNTKTYRDPTILCKTATALIFSTRCPKADGSFETSTWHIPICHISHLGNKTKQNKPPHFLNRCKTKLEDFGSFLQTKSKNKLKALKSIIFNHRKTLRFNKMNALTFARADHFPACFVRELESVVTRSRKIGSPKKSFPTCASFIQGWAR